MIVDPFLAYTLAPLVMEHLESMDVVQRLCVLGDKLIGYGVCWIEFPDFARPECQRSFIS